MAHLGHPPAYLLAQATSLTRLFTLRCPWFMTWLFYRNGNIFKISHTNFIFRKTIVRTRTVACRLQIKMGSVGI